MSEKHSKRFTQKEIHTMKDRDTDSKIKREKEIYREGKGARFRERQREIETHRETDRRKKR